MTTATIPVPLANWPPQSPAVTTPAHSISRSRTWPGTALLALLAGMALLDRPFGLLSVPGTPIYVTEIVLVSCVMLVLTRPGALGEVASSLWAAPLLVIAYLAWGLIRLLGSLDKPILDAVRDSALTYYALFALCAYALARVDERFSAPNLLGVYGRFVPWILVLAPIRLIFSAVVPALSTLPPTIPGSQVTLFGGHRPGNLGVHVALAVVYLATSGRRDRATSLGVVGGLITMALIATQNRGGLLAGLTVLAVAVWAWRRSARFRLAPTLAVLAALGAFAWGIDLRISAGARELSVEQFLTNMQSLVGTPDDRTDSNLEDTVDFRVELWQDVYAATVREGHLANGWGFGDNLGAAFLPGHQDKTLRNPHNSHLTVLVRLGVVGFILWIALLATWLARMIGRARGARGAQPWADPQARLAVLLAGGLVGMLVNSFFDPTLETPMAAVWLWVCVGLGLGVGASPKAERDVTH